MQSFLKTAYASSSGGEEAIFERRYSVSFLRRAERQRQAGFYNDVIVRVNGRDIGANQLVLGCFSEYFHEIFTSQKWDKNNPVVVIDDVDPESVSELIQFLYTESIKINHNNICDILAAADALRIEEAKDFCCQFLKNSISLDNYRIIRGFGECHRCRKLVENVDDFVWNHSEEIVQNQAFRNMTKDELIEYIQRRNKRKISESSMFTSIVEWTKHDLESRTKRFPDVFKEINLHEVDHDFLNNAVSNEVLVKDDPTCQALYVDALRHHLRNLQEYDRLHNSRRDKPFLIFGGENLSSKVKKITTQPLSWAEYTHSLTERFNSTCAVINEYVYLVGGQIKAREVLTATNTVERFNIDESEKENRWRKSPPMSEKRYVTGAAALNENIFVAGGADGRGDFLSSCECFDPNIGQWRFIDAMKEKRCGHGMVAFRGCLYAFGGHNMEKTVDTVEMYDWRVGMWRILRPMSCPRRWVAGAATETHVYAIGGDIIGNKSSPLQTVEKYDARANAWLQVAPMNAQRRGCGACCVAGKIYAVGGADTSSIHSTIESYEPSNNTWSIALDTQDKLIYPAVVRL